MNRRRFFCPEVIQASAMDCGPASLKCLLEGYGTPISYGRLREACQIDVDGASIDTIEEVAGQLGLDAQQVMLPLDHLLLEETGALPALVVVRMPAGDAHFVVAWRRDGPLVQVMDPATGRRWTFVGRFLEDCYVHTTEVPAGEWRRWAGSGLLDGLRPRLRSLGLSRQDAENLIREALDDVGWQSLAALDAAVRMTASMLAAGGVRRGDEATGVVRRLFDGSREREDFLPEEYWSVRRAPRAADGSEQVRLRGAVLIAVRGRQRPQRELSPELTAALEERPIRPSRALFRLMMADSALAPASLLFSLLLAAGAVLLEALFFRGFFDLSRELGLSGQRLGAVVALLTFLALLLLLELPLLETALRLGRRLECRLRLEFLRKIPRLGDRYFQSRLKSDMTERAHSIHRIRHLPDLGSQMTRYAFELVLTAAGIAWLDPRAAPLAALSAAVALVLPLAVQPALQERDLRVRTHTGALSRYYLDALLGLSAIRCHGAERPIRSEHEALLVEWGRAGLRLQRLAAGVSAAQMLTAFGLAIWLVFDHLSRHQQIGGVLLLVYWALNLPVLGQEIAQIAWQYPALRNKTLRLLEPLGALEHGPATAAPVRAVPALPEGMAVRMEGVNVMAGGHTILRDINVNIGPGSHVAIVGASGAGKSSLVGVLLGWHRASTGGVYIDGDPLEGLSLETLRRGIAWVDPAVHLWNRPFVDNLVYGAPDSARHKLAHVIEAADLVQVLQKMPDGLQTSLGESGSMVSGGEGQRVRVGRALLRAGVRLAILDEPFRGLERQQRRELLARVRRWWSRATLLCITHDVGETRTFERVLVVEQGSVVEDGSPAQLARQPSSRYRALLDAEDAVRERLWTDAGWRRLRLDDGQLVEESPITSSRVEVRWPAL